MFTIIQCADPRCGASFYVKTPETLPYWALTIPCPTCNSLTSGETDLKMEVIEELDEKPLLHEAFIEKLDGRNQWSVRTDPDTLREFKQFMKKLRRRR